MIYRIETALRHTRKLFSRNRFVVWLFGLPKSAGHGHEDGLIILQIDGLSRTQFERAVENGSMPFAARLLKREHYRLHSIYTGIPSSTPAAQGELFYGVRACVPAFRFKRPQDERTVVMLEPEIATDVQQQLEQQGGVPLLKQGSAYSNMFDGGADEASFCASSLGWSSLIPSRNFFKMTVFMLLNIVSLLRVVALTIAELVLSIVDLMRGVIGGQNVIKEILFVPVRIATSVLLRELVTIGVKLDAARGLPIIHANFLGYDEQSHRRGPESRFAHWSLKGIDRAIARIWKSARQSEYRDYDIWIYSDHGQETTDSFPDLNDRSLHDAVNEVLTSYVDAPELSGHEKADTHLDDPNYQHAHLLGSKKLNSWMSRQFNGDTYEVYVEFSMAAMGPLGFIYLNQALDQITRNAIAADLVEKANVPMVLMAGTALDDITRTAHVWTKDGEFCLPHDKDRVLGADHPFLDDVCEDLIELSHHEYSGEFILSGWSRDANTMSFRIENGAHAGPGAQETHAFALLPEDLPLPDNGRRYLRFRDLYETGRRLRGETVATADERLEAGIVAPRPRDFLRIMTYNVHSCIGMDGRISPRRIARVIAMYDPDIVALQELNVDCPKSMHIDQAVAIAGELNMHSEFHPVKQIEDGHFGNAIFSRYPTRLLDASQLATNHKQLRPRIEPLDQSRGVMEVEIDFEGHVFSLVNTHLGLTPEERKVQVADLLGPPRFTESRRPMILCGDFNATRKQHAHRALNQVMHDVEIELEQRRTAKTFPGKFPTLRIDHIFVDPLVKVRDVMVPNNHLTRVASDHLPLIADIDLAGIERFCQANVKTAPVS